MSRIIRKPYVLYEEQVVIEERARLLTTIDPSSERNSAETVCRALNDPNFWLAIIGHGPSIPSNAYVAAFLKAALVFFAKEFELVGSDVRAD